MNVALNTAITTSLAALIILSNTVFADSTNPKAGLWEMQTVSQLVDGRDIKAQMAAAQTQMQQAMANMSPAQRQQLQGMMQQHGASIDGSGVRICISPAMAASRKPVLNAQSHCEPNNVNHSGNKTSFEINCTSNGRTLIGKGESVNNGDTVNTRTDLTETDAQGHHTLHSEIQMSYLGADCQGVKPADQVNSKQQ